jgi:hypothetical protein
MIGTLLLTAAIVTGGASSATVTNDSDQTVEAVVQVYEGRAIETLEPGQSYTFSDVSMQGRGQIGAFWAVWIDGTLVDNGQFETVEYDLPATQPEGYIAEDPTYYEPPAWVTSVPTLIVAGAHPAI